MARRNSLPWSSARPIPRAGRRVRKPQGRVWNPRRRPLHRHGRLPAALSLARTNLRLQRIATAAQTDQLLHPSSSRLACRPNSRAVRIWTPSVGQGFGTRRVVVPVNSNRVLKPQSGEPFRSRQQVSPAYLARLTNAMEKEEELDGRCFPRPHQPGLWTVPVLCPLDPSRVAVSAAYSGARTHLYPPPEPAQAQLSGNILSRANWLSLGGTAQPERTILLVLEVLTLSGYRSSGQSNSEHRSSPRWSPPTLARRVHLPFQDKRERASRALRLSCAAAAACFDVTSQITILPELCSSGQVANVHLH